MSEKVPPIAGSLLFTSGLGFTQKRQTTEYASLTDTRRRGVVQFPIHSQANFELHTSEEIDAILDNKTEYLEARKLGSIAFAGISVGGLKSLIQYKKYRDKLLAEGRVEEANSLSAYLITTRTRGSEGLKEEDYVDRENPEKSFTTTQGFTTLKSTLELCEGIIIPSLTVDDKKGIHILVATYDDRIPSRKDSKINGVPLYPIAGADSHVKGHGEFCAKMGAHLAAARAFTAVQNVDASQHI